MGLMFLVSGYGNGIDAPLALYEYASSRITRVWETAARSPSFLTLCRGGLYALCESDEGGALTGFAAQRAGARPLGSTELPGGLLCHVAGAPEHGVVYGACYRTGHVIAVRADGGAPGAVLQDFVLGEDEHRLTRAHCCLCDRREQRLLVTNIALDRLYCFDIRPDGTLIPNAANEYLSFPAGKGPRHIALCPGTDDVCCITEYSNELLLIRYDPESGTLTAHGEVSTLPDGFTGESFGSSLQFSADGRHLYAANRGANTIAVFELGGALPRKIQDAPCGGNWPRHIALADGGRMLLVANQLENSVTLLPRDPDSGRLSPAAARLPFGAPSFVLDAEGFM